MVGIKPQLTVAEQQVRLPYSYADVMLEKGILFAPDQDLNEGPYAHPDRNLLP